MHAQEQWNQIASPCFVSHSYRDVDALEKLKEQLPGNVELEIFGRVEPDPANAVSDGVIPRIRACNSLIYLERGASAASFWVSFERDYALRAGLDVFAYDPFNDSVRVDTSNPMRLEVNTLYHPNDEHRVEALLDWMRTERNFQLELKKGKGRLGGVRSADAMTLQDLLVNGGVLLWFAGEYSKRLITQFRTPGFGQHDEDFTTRIAETRLARGSDGLDDVSPLNEDNAEFYYVTDPYHFVSDVHVRVDPDLPAAWQPPGAEVIDVLANADVDSGFNWNRIDDLIIRLYAALAIQRRRVMSSPPQTRAVMETNLPVLVDYWEKHPDEVGRVRLGAGKRPYAEWVLSVYQAQRVLDRAALWIHRRYGVPTQITPLEYPNYPFEEGFPVHFAVVWPRGESAIELSMELDGPLSAVFARHLLLPEQGETGQ